MNAMYSDGFRARNRIETTAMSALTTMRVGGPCTLVTIDHRADLAEAMQRGGRWLGRGANLLVGDAGLSDAVLRLGSDFAALDIGPVRGGRALVQAGAAVDLADLIATCVRAGLAGPEGLAGVPATVGGALRMNAGTATVWMLDCVARVEAWLPGEAAPRWIERAEIAAAYRSCGLPPGSVFLGCVCELAQDDPERLRAEAARLKRRKAETQPLALPSAGCVFRNPSKDLPAGRLIDELGLKGTRRGGASISTVHGNFIVNDSRKASCADICALIDLIRARAWRERGVVLDMEIEDWACPPGLREHPSGLKETAA
jgi:UDP-N-acetylmuramate dehydrogenase